MKVGKEERKTKILMLITGKTMMKMRIKRETKRARRFKRGRRCKEEKNGEVEKNTK